MQVCHRAHELLHQRVVLVKERWHRAVGRLRWHFDSEHGQLGMPLFSQHRGKQILRSHSRAHPQPRSPTHLAISRNSSKSITSSSTLICVVTGRAPFSDRTAAPVHVMVSSRKQCMTIREPDDVLRLCQQQPLCFPKCLLRLCGDPSIPIEFDASPRNCLYPFTTLMISFDFDFDFDLCLCLLVNRM